MNAFHRLTAASAAALLPLLAGCWYSRNVIPSPPPVVFQQPPSLADLLATVNGQTDRVNDLQADAARLSVPGYPTSLRASLRLLRPRHMRLRGTFLNNPMLDMGSNDERFWLWSSNSPVLYARHQQFAHSAASQLLPVEPTWLVEAMGLIHFQPNGPHEGPFRRDDGMIEVHTRVASGAGQRVRVVAVHPQYGYITEVQMRDERGQLLAVARADRHRYDEAQGVTLPHRVQLELTASQLPVRSFTFESESYTVNRLQAAAANPALWTMPPGPSQDLADPRLQLSNVAPQGAATPASGRPADSTARGFRPEYRGYTR